MRSRAARAVSIVTLAASLMTVGLAATAARPAHALRGPDGIKVSPAGDDIQGSGFMPSASVAWEIRDKPAGSVLASGTSPTDGGGHFGVGADQHGVDIVPGYAVQATDGATTKKLTVKSITLEVVDYSNDVASGKAVSGATVVVGLSSGPSLSVPATGGVWTADFGANGFQIDVTDYVIAEIFDTDGDSSFADRPPPTFEGNLTFDNIGGCCFAPNASVTVDVYDGPGGNLLASGPSATDGQGGFEFLAGLDLVPGDFITVGDGIVTKELTLVSLTIDVVDVANDTVSGSAPPNSVFNVDVETPTGWVSAYPVTSDGTGAWTADFASLGVDLTPVSHVGANIGDADNDQTAVDAILATFEGNLAFDNVSGCCFAKDSSVTVEVYDAPGGNLLASGPSPTDPDGGFFFFSQGLDLVSGMFITVSDGVKTKQLTLVGLTIDAIDPANDTVSGTAPPNVTFNVDASEDDGPWMSAYPVTSDGTGAWTADFAAIGVDLTPFTHVGANVGDDDGDQTATDRAGTTGCVLQGTRLRINVTQGESITVSRSGNGFNVTGMGDPTCGGATMSNVDLVEITGAGGIAESLTLDLSGGQFAPGATPEGSGISEIEFGIDLLGGQAAGDTTLIRGSSGPDAFALGGAGVNLNNDDDADVTALTGPIAPPGPGPPGLGAVTVNGGAGRDAISGAGSAATGSAYPDALTINGGGGNDTLTGGKRDDSIDGATGNDILIGQRGTNSLAGGVGNDRAVYTWSPSGMTANLAVGSASGTAFTDTLSSIESITGSNFADVLRGNAAANSMVGRAGNDKVNVVDGVGGNDSANGGTGTDTCLVDSGDTVVGCEA